MNLISECEVTCILPVKDLARARRFYEEQLKLEVLGARPDGKFAYRCGGTTIALFPKADGTQAERTALSFRVDRIEPAVAELQRRGVRFADHDLPGLKSVGHVCVLGSEEGGLVRGPRGQHPVSP